MTDLLRLILAILASPFKSRAELEAENLILRQQINVLCRRMPKRPALTNVDRFLSQRGHEMNSRLAVLECIPGHSGHGRPRMNLFGKRNVSSARKLLGRASSEGKKLIRHRPPAGSSLAGWLALSLASPYSFGALRQSVPRAHFCEKSRGTGRLKPGQPHLQYLSRLSSPALPSGASSMNQVEVPSLNSSHVASRPVNIAPVICLNDT
jgi:hypothetical protein